MTSAGSCASVALLLALTIPVRGHAQATTPATQAPAAAASHPAPPPQFEKGLFDLRVGSLLTESDVGLVNDRGVILIPVDRLLTLTGLTAISSSDSTRTIPAYGSTTPAVLDIPNHVIRRLGQKYPIAEDEATLLLGTWYLASDRIAEFLGAHVVADLSSLLVFVSRDPPFPSEQLRASNERRAAYGVGLETPDDRMEGATFLRQTGGLTADWSLSSSATRSSQDYGLQMALGMAVLGGSLSASSAATKNGLDTRVLQSSWQYTYANPANDWLRSVQLGNAAAATSGRAIDGIALSNTHLFHSGPFSVTRIAPNVPPGWSYEVYQNGQLVGFSDANTRTPVAVRLAYGSTPVEIRFHGPAGEEIKSTYVYQIDIDRLAPGRIEYGAGMGKCPLVAGCSVAYGNVAAGLTQWLTASGGVESIDSTVHHTDPYARLIMATASGWKANTEWTPTLRHARVTYFGPGLISGSVDGGRIAAVGPEASITSAAGDRNYIEPEATFSIPHGLGMPASLRLESRGERLISDGRVGARVGSILSMGRVQGTLEYRDELTGDGPMISTGGLWFAPPSWSRFGQPTVSGSVGEVHGRLDVIDLSPTWNTSGRGSVSAHLGWSQSTHGVSLSLTYNAFTGRLRESVGMNSGPRQPASTNVVVGSLGMYDPVFGFTSSDRVSPNAAGISGRAFYDEDGDGKFGPGDRPAPTVIVQAAGQSSSADDLGRYRIPGILPYEPVRVSVDTVDGIDPSYVPAVASLDVRLSPNAMTRVDIPLLKTREAAGTIKADSLVATVGGITIELRDTKTDKVVYTTPTFADGTFYMGRIIPGKYRVVVSRRSLVALGAVAEGDGIEIDVEPKGDAPVMIPTIRLLGGAQRDPLSP